MPSSLYRGGLILARANRSAALACCRRWCSSDALVEVKPGEVGLVSGIPEEHLRRRVIIYSPARTATQQGSGKVGRWKLIFCLHKSGKIHLMAWTSTGDPYANVGEAGLSFDSEEEVAYTSSEDISSPSHMLTTSRGRAQQRARMINVVHATIQRSYILML